MTSTRNPAVEDLEDFHMMCTRWGRDKAYDRWATRCGENHATVLRQAVSLMADSYVWKRNQIVSIAPDLENDINKAAGRPLTEGS